MTCVCFRTSPTQYFFKRATQWSTPVIFYCHLKVTSQPGIFSRRQPNGQPLFFYMCTQNKLDIVTTMNIVAWKAVNQVTSLLPLC